MVMENLLKIITTKHLINNDKLKNTTMEKTFNN